MMNRRGALGLLGVGALVVATQRLEASAPERMAAVEDAFKPGDVLVGCTRLDDPNDDHRGRGRILHYDSRLQLKREIWINDSTHLIQGLRFAPDRSLWAFDAFAFKILRFSPSGRRLPAPPAPARSFAHVTFAADGRYFLGESLVGTGSRVPLQTTLPRLAGTNRHGDGHLFEFASSGRLLRQHPTPTHGGMAGFQGLSFSALSPGGRTLVYTSETGPRIMHWDLDRARALPDIVDEGKAEGRFFFDVAFDDEGRLLVLTGTEVQALDLSGKLLRRYPLGSFGFASLSRPIGKRIYACNFFSGEIVRLELDSGAISARVDTGARKSAAGVAEFPG